MKLGAIVIDTDQPLELADFYARLLHWTVHPYDEQWTIVKSDSGEGTPLVFQLDPHYRAPVWPAKPGDQQQMQHLDLYTVDVQAGVGHALDCGAVLAGEQFDDGWRVLLDPSGHPFCILPTTPPGQ